MALQVWLPLIKDTNSLGLSTVSGSISNASISYADGKLGKSIRIANYQTTTATYAGITNIERWSICVWLKINSSDSFTNYNDFFIVGMNNDGATGGGFRIEHTSVAGAIQIPVPKTAGLTDQNTWYTFYSNTTCSKDQWAHIAVVNDGTNYYTYINGALASTVPISRFTTTTSKLTGTITLGMNGSYCYMNDLRIYNHPLSLNEVREISKGLVLHWACNKSGTGKDNIVPGSSANEASYTYPSSNYSDKWTATTSIVPSASQYILSFWAKSTVNGDKVRSHWYSPNTTTKCESSQGTVTTAVDGSMDYTLSTDWKFYWCIYTQSETTAVKHLIFPRLWSGNGTGTVSVKCIKLEEGNVPTPWRPNSNDSGYSTFGYNSTVERDLSGLQRDGTIASAFPTVEAGAPRYSCSYKYSGNVNNAHYNNTTELNYTDNFSWSIWVKTNFTGSITQYIFTVGRADAGGYGYGLQCASTTSCTVRYGNATWAVAVTGGEWTHLAFTKSGTTCKIYKNGALYSTNTFSGTAPTYSDGNGVGIGCFHYSSNIYPYYGSISDFRIYATCLTDTDIKALYSTAASICNNGVIMAYNFIEE